MHGYVRLASALTILAIMFSLTLWAAPIQASTLNQTGGMQTYIVLYKSESVASDAASAIAQAGGTLVYSYTAIGVAIARSENAAFRANLLRDSRIENVSSTAGFGIKIDDVAPESHDEQPAQLPNAPATDSDSLSALQWDMRQIHTPEAHAITGGSPLVTVGILDTGVDKDHPDLVQNIDFSKSASCESGAPVQNPAAWDDRQGHGTHTAGTVAAASNGFGIVGVAPNVKIAAVKTSTDQGFFFPEMVICAFMWAGAQHLDVTNNSYFADPFLFNCHNDQVQQAIWKAEYRAIRYAMTQGVTVVASAGNESQDLAHPTIDDTSPSNGTPQIREVTNACLVIPAEVPGVITVTANGNHGQKSFYSSYGVGKVEVVAPGGDSLYGITPQAPNGRVLSTWPADRPCSRSVKEPANDPNEPLVVYCYLQGTSMAGPHVAGVAALIISRYGDLQNPQNGKMRPEQVEQYLNHTADTIPCPETYAPAAAFPQPNGEPQQCQGGVGYNSFYGYGQVNALRAVTHATGN